MDLNSHTIMQKIKTTHSSVWFDSISNRPGTFGIMCSYHQKNPIVMFQNTQKPVSNIQDAEHYFPCF